MHTVSGGCHCGNIGVTLRLPRPPNKYQPRACDCDFCSRYDAAYVSDAQGSLAIEIEDASAVENFTQGDQLAQFMICRKCAVLIGAHFRVAGRLYAAVNARVADASVDFGEPLVVSPKKLSAPEKQQRWQSLWFADVRITGLTAGTVPTRLARY